MLQHAHIFLSLKNGKNAVLTTVFKVKSTMDKYKTIVTQIHDIAKSVGTSVSQ